MPAVTTGNRKAGMRLIKIVRRIFQPRLLNCSIPWCAVTAVARTRKTDMLRSVYILVAGRECSRSCKERTKAGPGLESLKTRGWGECNCRTKLEYVSGACMAKLEEFEEQMVTKRLPEVWSAPRTMTSSVLSWTCGKWGVEWELVKEAVPRWVRISSRTSQA